MNKWPYNTRQWRKVRKMKLNEYPLCANCEVVGLTVTADMVHHIKPVSEHPELAFDIDNLMSLCNQCHNSIEARGMMTGTREDGSPVDPGHSWWEK